MKNTIGAFWCGSLGCFVVAGQCHEMGKGKGALLPALIYFCSFGKVLFLYLTSKLFFSQLLNETLSVLLFFLKGS